MSETVEPRACMTADEIWRSMSDYAQRRTSVENIADVLAILLGPDGVMRAKARESQLACAVHALRRIRDKVYDPVPFAELTLKHLGDVQVPEDMYVAEASYDDGPCACLLWTGDEPAPAGHVTLYRHKADPNFKG